MKNRYRFIKPPRALRRSGIRLDNFSLVSANLLGNMGIYRALTDRQPRGTAVLVLPSPTSPLRRVYAAVARVLKADGKRVKLYAVHHPEPPRSIGHVGRAQRPPQPSAVNR